MPSTQSRNVGEEPKNLCIEVLEQNDGEAASRDFRQALEEAGYKYPPSVVLNELINDGRVEKDEENGTYRLTDEGGGQGNRGGNNRGRNQGAQGQGQRQGQGHRSRNQNFPETGEGMRMIVERLREINDEERQLIQEVEGRIDRLAELASAIVGESEQGGQGSRGNGGGNRGNQGNRNQGNRSGSQGNRNQGGRNNRDDDE